MKHGKWTDVGNYTTNWMRSLSWEVRGARHEDRSFSLQTLHPYKARVTSGQRDKAEIIGLGELQLRIGNAYVSGTKLHSKTLELLTNACFQLPASYCKLLCKTRNTQWNKIVLKKTRDTQWNKIVLKPTRKGCSAPKEYYPDVIPTSARLPIRIETHLWNCMIGNIANLLASLGQYDEQMKQQIDLLHSQMHECRYKDIRRENTTHLQYFELPSMDPFKRLKTMLRGAKYQVINTPNEMNFAQLDDLLKKTCLPMLVSLELKFGNQIYKHVIGICPNKPVDGQKIGFRIIDGAHPHLKSIHFSLENLNWCCGRDSSFSVASDGILLFPNILQTKKIMHDWSHLYYTMEDIIRAGISVSLSIEGNSKFCIPKHVAALNCMSKTKKEIDAIVKKLKNV